MWSIAFIMSALRKNPRTESKLWLQAKKWAATTPAPAAQARNTNIAAEGNAFSAAA